MQDGMWFAAALATTLFASLLVLREAARSSVPMLTFLILALWLRYTLSAFPDLTHPKLVGGLSINAIGSIATVLVGVAIIPARYFFLKLLIPLYAFAALIVASGVLNLEFGGLVSSITRILYMLVIQLSLFVALSAIGRKRVFRALMPVFALPIALQLASIALGKSTASADALGRSFIGGYGHEGDFSMILITMLLAAMFWQPKGFALKGAVVLWSVAGLIFANYRTAVIAALPMALVTVLVAFTAGLARRERPVGIALVVAIFLPMIFGGIALSSAVMERFGALSQVASIDVFKSPFEFTRYDQDMLSGRIYIWSQYIDGFVQADLLQQAFGHGPESWNGVFAKYAHNTYLSYLYEFGVVGLAVFVVYFLANAAVCLLVRDTELMIKLLGAYACFAILNFATMPLWQISGVIFFGLLNGTAMHAAVTADGRRHEHGSALAKVAY